MSNYLVVIGCLSAESSVTSRDVMSFLFSFYGSVDNIPFDPLFVRYVQRPQETSLLFGGVRLLMLLICCVG